jgi:hypothetical protein
MIRPKWIGSTPNRTATGRRIGDRTMISIWYFAKSDGRAIQCVINDAPATKTIGLAFVPTAGTVTGDEDDDDTGNDVGPGTGGDPTLPNGFIWVDDNSPTVGMLFEDGKMFYLYYDSVNKRWSGREQLGVLDGNKIIAYYDEDPDTTFTVSGDTLYEYRLPDNTLMTTFTKTAGTILGQTN